MTSKGLPAPCPACGGALSPRGDDGACPRCGGVWLSLETCHALARGSLPTEQWRGLTPDDGRACLPRHERRPTGRCPVGDEALEPGQAWGHPVEVCRAHGTFVPATTRLVLDERVEAGGQEDESIDALVRAMRRPAPYDRVTPWFRGGSPITGVVHALLLLLLFVVLAPSLLPEPRWPMRLFGAAMGTLTLALALRRYRIDRDAPP